MKMRTVRLVKKYIICIAVLIVTVLVFFNSSIFILPVTFFAQKFTKSAVSFVLPVVSEKTVDNDLLENKPFNEPDTNTTKTKSTQKQSEKTTATKSNKTVLASSEETGGRVISQTIDKSGATASYGDVYIKNKTAFSINIKEEISKRPELKIQMNSKKPQVLIVHTHATECFFPKLVNYYPKSWGERNTDKTKNMVAVGKVICDKLNNCGINTVQSNVLHDKDEYNGSYDRSRETIKNYLKKYPSIKVVLDVHRDAINEEDGDRIRPIVNIKNKTAGQIMIISGCESGPITGYPNWRKNLHFSLRLQKMIEQTYPSLARPLFFAEKKYNQDLCPNSILVEIGSQANLIEESKYSAKLFSNVLVKYLKGYAKN